MHRNILMAAVTVLTLSSLLNACATVSPNYKTDAANQATLATFKVSHVAIGTFTEPNHISSICRARGPIRPPEGMTYAAFIRNALEQEIRTAGGLASGTPDITLTGHLNVIDFSTSFHLVRGYWDLSLELLSSNGQALSVNEHYEFNSGFVGHIACNRAAKALPPAVDALIHKIVINKKFSELLIAK